MSVIIPTYQRERVLCETLDSLLKQTYPDFEVIVLDQSRSHSPETAQYLAEFTSRANCFVATEDTPGLPRADSWIPALAGGYCSLP